MKCLINNIQKHYKKRNKELKKLISKNNKENKNFSKKSILRLDNLLIVIIIRIKLNNFYNLKITKPYQI